MSQDGQKEDRYFDGLLNAYLKSQEEPDVERYYVCPYCGDQSKENTMCCEEMHREEVWVEVEIDNDNWHEPEPRDREFD